MLDADGAHVWKDGDRLPLSVAATGPGRYSVLLDGRSRSVIVESVSESGMTIRTSSGRRTITWKDRRALLLESMGFESGRDRGEREVRAPMPGLVLDVLVEVGQEVRSGDGLVVLEAMKMENELRAATAGTVHSVRVAAGEAVAKDALLIEIES